MTDQEQSNRIREQAALYRANHPHFARWAAGYGPICHRDDTQVKVFEMASLLCERQQAAEIDEVFDSLLAADRLACAGLWLVAHMTYARQVYTDGRALQPADFKADPEGHTGGSLNMVPAYVGYLALNAISGFTRSWLMGQGHCVAAIDALNLLADNMNPEHALRYSLSDEGLSRLVQDFYSYRLGADGRAESPLGSHVNPHTAGGVMEGGYLGFAELQYVHMPLPGERLVAFLSDGAFEEQRGSDWMSRWWRAEDCGLVTPVMIANGRRIDQRTRIGQPEGVRWFHQHLELNGFKPLEIDGTDPAAFVVGLFEAEELLQAAVHALCEGRAQYPQPLPYLIAETSKGWGFPGAGTNAAHNLPLVGNPATDAQARERFNQGAARLFVPLDALREAVANLNRHERQGRLKERDHSLARRRPPSLQQPPLSWKPLQQRQSPMAALDDYFVDLVNANPGLRVRVGNPDEMRSNKLNRSLDLLKHRVLSPEPGVAEALDGCVITALNEEAVVSAALANKGGLNLVASYEAFAVKMLGAIRQEAIFARHQKEIGEAPQWHSVPILATSHTWENGKNEQSHQDPTLAEALLGEMSDTTRVMFPADANSAIAALAAVYQTRGSLAALVVPKRALPVWFNADQAEQLAQDGIIRLDQCGEPAVVELIACGGYQLREAQRATQRLREAGIGFRLYYLLEPARLRQPRDAWEAAFCRQPGEVGLGPFSGARLLLTHTRPEVMTGLLWPLARQCDAWSALGYRNRGGTLDEAGMLFANGCSWAHVLAEIARLSQWQASALLSDQEQAALRGETDPRVILAAAT